ncbi:MAG TPA: peptidoglycan-binding domain-containing protein, partial [Pyrinomonadaceae bacterium]|nr:peptidoglycan-binding domain-containing protein [Pyrinomonadaceae bacterium]
MRSPTEQLKSEAVSFLRVWPVLFLLMMVFVNSPDVVANSPAGHLHQGMGIKERRQAEQRLWELGYWVGPIDGKFDSASRQALIAFQKVEGRARTGKLTSTELNALLLANRPQPRFVGYGHIEIDLTRQVLFVIDETGTVSRILTVSTGNEGRYVDHGQIHRAHTP